MKSTLLPFVMIMTLLFLLPTGCRKDDSVSQREQADEQLMRDFLSDDYFATASEYYNPSPADPSAQTTTESRTKKSMTASLKDYFAKNPQEVKKINQKYGYPVWKHVENFNDGNDFIVVPFARTNKSKIDAFLINYFDDTSKKHKFMTVVRSKIDKYFKKNQIKKVGDRYAAMSYELAAVNTIHFENEIFSTVDCNLLSSFNFRNEKELENRSCSVSSQTFSGYTLICVGSNENPCVHSYIEPWSVTITTANCSTDLDYDAPPGDGSSSSGGSGWSGDNLTGYPLAPNQDISIPKISYNSSNENILKQVLIVLRLHYYYNNCLSGVTNQATSIDWSRYFDNISNYKTIPTTTVTIGGLTVSASIDFNFTLSGNYTNDKFRSSVVVQDQGTTFGSGYSKESYDLFGHYSNAPLINIGVTSGTDQNFIKIISNCN